MACFVEDFDVVEADVQESKGAGSFLSPQQITRRWMGAQLVNRFENTGHGEIILELDDNLLIRQSFEHRENELHSVIVNGGVDQ